jgi:endogenous inhibitor of DNA gyrase (YacG/DUF329 family)
MCDKCIEFDGKRWHRYGGYYEYRGTRSLGRRDRQRLHRALWEHRNGPIPDGHEIHHIDGDIYNNEIANLECMAKGAHSSEHRKRSPLVGPDWKKRKTIRLKCKDCGAAVDRKVRKHDPICIRCQQIRGDAARTTERECVHCGTAFKSIRGRFCSQRCVNLGARWKG